MSYNTPNYAAQGGTQLVIGGTLTVSSGGSIQVASGGAISFGGGALRNIAFGSVVLTNGGSATVGVGFAVQGFAGVVAGRDGSISGVGEDRSLYSAGSVIVYGLSGTLAATTQRGTVSYVVFG